jgi:putative N6-adenine-specific DNA methylase
METAPKKINFDFNTKGDFEMKVTTFFGLEEVLASELLRLGGKNIEPFKRGVSVTGDIGYLYKVNLCSRVALRVLIPIYKFNARNDKELYDGIKKFPWDDFMKVTDTLAVEGVPNSEYFQHSLYVEQKTKDAICDRFREISGDKRPSVDLKTPTLRIYVHIFKDEVSVSLDSSGDILYKRGYREDIIEAPIKEVLAAGIVLISGWQPHLPLIDGMCGSGTLAIEAALFAGNIPAGIFRKEFGFMRWKNYDEKLYDTIFESAVSRIKEDIPNITANDISDKSLNVAKVNVSVAKVDDAIKFTRKSFFDVKVDKPMGTVLLNPPYDERMKKEDIVSFYKQIGDKLKKDFSGWTAWIITSNLDAAKFIGLRPTRKITLFNGSLECRLFKFEMYSGTKKVHKFQEKG